jgi:hypothetical protein
MGEQYRSENAPETRKLDSECLHEHTTTHLAVQEQALVADPLTEEVSAYHCIRSRRIASETEWKRNPAAVSSSGASCNHRIVPLRALRLDDALEAGGDDHLEPVEALQGDEDAVALNLRLLPPCRDRSAFGAMRCRAVRSV